MFGERFGVAGRVRARGRRSRLVVGSVSPGVRRGAPPSGRGSATPRSAREQRLATASASGASRAPPARRSRCHLPRLRHRRPSARRSTCRSRRGPPAAGPTTPMPAYVDSEPVGQPPAWQAAAGRASSSPGTPPRSPHGSTPRRCASCCTPARRCPAASGWPGGSAASTSGLVAGWNGGFLMANNASWGGFYLGGRTDVRAAAHRDRVRGLLQGRLHGRPGVARRTAEHRRGRRPAEPGAADRRRQARRGPQRRDRGGRADVGLHQQLGGRARQPLRGSG